MAVTRRQGEKQGSHSAPHPGEMKGVGQPRQAAMAAGGDRSQSSVRREDYRKIQTKFKILQCLESKARWRLVPREATLESLHDLQTRVSSI